jgi:hypothetical protein
LVDLILLGDGAPALFKKGIVEIGERYKVGIFGGLKLEFYLDIMVESFEE